MHSESVVGTPSIDKTLAADLTQAVRAVFSDMTVTVELSERWNRPCATFTWAAFEGLLPEERFHKLVAVIPREVRENRMTGYVWLELSPGESIEAYLKLPRSEDTAGEEPEVYASLTNIGFFDALAEAMGAAPENTCRGDLSRAEAALTSAKYSALQVRDAKLLFIRYGVYCDCQVLNTVRPELAKLYAGAA